MVALQAALVAYMFDRRVFPVVAVALALAGLSGRARVGLTRNGQAGVALLAFVVVVVEWRLILVDQDIPTVLFLGSFGYPVAQYFLTLQALAFFLRTGEGRLPTLFPIFSAFVMAYAGDIVTLVYQTPAFQGAALLFVFLLGLYLLSGRTPVRLTRSTASHGRTPAREPARCAGGWSRAIAQGAVLCVALGVAVSAGLLLNTYGRKIDNVFADVLFRVVRPPALGFSAHARLGSMARLKQGAGMETALRVYSDTTPGYLRGRAFDTYVDAEWHITGQERPLRLADPSDPGRPRPTYGQRLYPLDNRTAAAWRGMNVRPRIESNGFLFTALDSLAVAVRQGGVTTDDNRNAKLIGSLPRTGYEAFKPLSAEVATPRLSDEMRQRLTAVPDDLDPRVRALARRLFDGRDTSTGKILAVVNYFLANYAYQLGLDVPKGVDPLTYFLLEQPPAHCEYFASGAAMLLRLGGVPCRYVTGFVASEYNGVGGYWIARSKDAHAWVEAYHNEGGWVVVEATVADGVPAPNQDKGRRLFAHLWDSAKYLVQQLHAAYRFGGWRDVVLAAAQGAYTGFLRVVTSVPGLLLVAVVVAVSVIRVRRRRSSRPKRQRIPPKVAALNKLLRRTDRRLRRRGLVRPPNETLHHFAARIEGHHGNAEFARSAARWYVAYALVRYGGRINQDEVERLRAHVPR